MILLRRSHVVATFKLSLSGVPPPRMAGQEERPTRKPLLLFRFPGLFLLRFVGRCVLLQAPIRRPVASKAKPLPGGTQQSSVRATRKPRVRLLRYALRSLSRFAERWSLGLLPQEPPRNTRRLQSPRSHALPSLGAPR